MLVEISGELIHRLGLLFSCDSKSIVRLRPVLIPQFGEFLAEPVIVQSSLGSSLIESPMAANDFLRCHRPVVD